MFSHVTAVIPASLMLWTCFVSSVLCNNENSSTFLASIYRPYLTNLTQKPQDFNPKLGGQNFDKCCQLAINESLVIDNDTLRIRPGQSIYRGTMATLEAFPSFPCFSKFNGSLLGPHQDFWVPYKWCHQRCPGWSATKVDNFDNWLKPLVSFIFPALVFCLSIPRRRRIELPNWLFSRVPNTVVHVVLFLVKMPVAAFIVTVDTVVWLAVVFSIAGPMLVSGIYEALLDNRILNYLETKIQTNALTIQERAHLLFVVLLGNLDFTPAWEHSRHLVADLPNDNIRLSLSQARPGEPVITPAPESSHGHSPSRSTLSPSIPLVPIILPLAPRNESLIVSVKIKLISMLDSQYSFGSSVGAPVAFYIGSFIYAIFEINDTWGS